MDALIGTYEDEWAKAVKDADVRKQFRQFANTVSSFLVPPYTLAFVMAFSDIPRDYVL